MRGPEGEGEGRQEDGSESRKGHKVSCRVRIDRCRWELTTRHQERRCIFVAGSPDMRQVFQRKKKREAGNSIGLMDREGEKCSIRILIVGEDLRRA